MLNFLVIALMLALTALYTAEPPELGATVVQSRSAAQAATMANYRTMVVDYYRAHPDHTALAPPAPGSPLAVNHADWGNYHEAGSPTVIVYARTAPAPDLLAAVLALSANSALVGTSEGGYFKSSQSNAVSTLPLALPDLAARSPVWLASINPRL